MWLIRVLVLGWVLCVLPQTVAAKRSLAFDLKASLSDGHVKALSGWWKQDKAACGSQGSARSCATSVPRPDPLITPGWATFGAGYVASLLSMIVAFALYEAPPEAATLAIPLVGPIIAGTLLLSDGFSRSLLGATDTLLIVAGVFCYIFAAIELLGVTLAIIGHVRDYQKATRPKKRAQLEWRMSPWFNREAAGLVVSGRF